MIFVSFLLLFVFVISNTIDGILSIVLTSMMYAPSMSLACLWTRSAAFESASSSSYCRIRSTISPIVINSSIVSALVIFIRIRIVYMSGPRTVTISQQSFLMLACLPTTRELFLSKSIAPVRVDGRSTVDGGSTRNEEYIKHEYPAS